MCEEEADDPEAVSKLLEINDSIHRTIERYKLMKKGDFDGASRISKGTLGITTGVNANNELSLIDFDPEPGRSAAPAAPTPAHGTSALEDDLLGLSFEDSRAPAARGAISLGLGMLFLYLSYLSCLLGTKRTCPLWANPKSIKPAIQSTRFRLQARRPRRRSHSHCSKRLARFGRARPGRRRRRRCSSSSCCCRAKRPLQRAIHSHRLSLPALGQAAGVRSRRRSSSNRLSQREAVRLCSTSDQMRLRPRLPRPQLQLQLQLQLQRQRQRKTTTGTLHHLCQSARRRTKSKC